MKKTAFIVSFLVLWSLGLLALPQHMHVIKATPGKETGFGCDQFYLHGSMAYILDNNRGTIKAWDINNQTYLDAWQARLPQKTKGTDLSGNEEHLYVLDNSSSSIYMYNYNGDYIRTISTQSSPDIEFQKASRILVNYQSYIFVLDLGRRELLAFGNEGMFLGKTEIANPISMTLGDDQLIRVLVAVGSNYEIRIYDQFLNMTNRVKIQTPQNKPDEVIDIAVNQYNETYIIYGKSHKIGKISAEGNLVSKIWGTKEAGLGPGLFVDPVAIKTMPAKDNAVIGILDKAQRFVKIHLESDFDSTTRLEEPQITMRTFLEEIPGAVCYDNLVADTLNYTIYDTIVEQNGKKKHSRALSCKSANRTLFTLYSIAETKRGVLSFDSMALHQDRLFVLDSKSHKVYIYNRLSGEYYQSFGGKGNTEAKLNNPRSIVISPDGTVYIADYANFRISTFSVDTTPFEPIDLKMDKLKPELLRISGNYLYFLANGTTIYEMPLASNASRYGKKKLVDEESVTTFDLLYDERLGYVNGKTQRLTIIFNNNREKQFFASNKTALFPHFADIRHIRYNPEQRSLLISDAGAKTMRRLNFWYSPRKPKTVSLTLTDEMLAELSWTRAEGISRWKVYETSDLGTITRTVTEPVFTISEAQQKICRYSISSVAADGKPGPPSEEIEDAYSYGRYLLESKQYSLAIEAFKRASTTINDPRLEAEIIRTYLAESREFSSVQEYEKALQCMFDAAAAVGNKIELILETTRLYRFMGSYMQALNHLERYNPEENKELLRELIGLNYLIDNHLRVLTLTDSYIVRYGPDPEISLYRAKANQKLGNYQAALDAMRELLMVQNNLANNLMIGELLIQCQKYTDAIVHADRILSTYTSGNLDEAHAIKGDAYAGLGHYGNATDAYGNAIKLNPNKAEYYFKLGNAYQESRNGPEAMRNFANAWELDTTNVNYGFAYAITLERARRISEALCVMDSLNKYLTDENASTEFHVLYSELLTSQQRYDDACRELELALEYAPGDAILASKLEAANQTRDYFNQNKPEVEIRGFSFDNIFPSLHKYYDTHPLGTLSVFNNRSNPIQNITLRLSIPGIADEEWVETIPTLMQNSSQALDIILPLNRQIFSECKNGPKNFPTRLTVEYSYDNQPRSFVYGNISVPVMSVNSMNWANRKQFASFINPADQNLLNFVSTQIVQLFTNVPAPSMNKNIQRAMQVWSVYRANGLSFVSDRTISNQDSSEDDYAKYPFQTLNLKSGDCEDLLAVMAASLSVIGVDCGFIDIPGHVMLVVDTKMSFNQSTDSGFDLQQFIFRDSKYWLPLETTLIGKESFSTAWSYAIQSYNEYIKKSNYPDIIEFADAHKIYPPADYTEEISIRPYGARQEAINYYLKDLEIISNVGLALQEQEYIRTMDKYPNNFYVANEYAMWCFERGKTSKARELWERILRDDLDNFNALVNLGNLYFETKDYEQARSRYLEALKQNQQTDQLYRNLCLTEYYSGNLSKAKDYLSLLSDPDLLRRTDPKAYSDLSK